tara:strand:+ start:978 stop:1925 length:948 start_codon:yes stop_codon:yes gene_type:complete
MENIKALLRRAAMAYYNGKPIMSDEEFDSLAELHNFEEVGTTDGRIPHAYPMYSLQKVFSTDLNSNPLKSYASGVTVTPKLDGAAVAITYVNGEFRRALTRGDGKKGLDISNHMKTLVPNRLTSPVPSLLQITGEVVAPKTIKNARNYAAGALNLKSTTEFVSRELIFIAHNSEPYVNDSYANAMAELRDTLGFDTVLDSDWTKYPHDGVVFRIDSYKDFEKFGHTSRHPRGAYALKERQEGVITTLVDVKWQVGKSGVVAPVGILEPTEIDGAVVSRATLHNMAHIEGLDLEIGCLVEVIRSGEIIPRIVRRVD